MINIIKSPWNIDQVKSLNAYQKDSRFHPFTCGEHDVDGLEHPLEATINGWFCPNCRKIGKEYTQNWCHEWMASWSWQQLT